MNRRLVAAVAISIASCGAAFPQGDQFAIDGQLHNWDRPYIKATGEATMSVKPDQAVVEIGVTSEASTAAAAAAQNAKQANALVAQLTSVLGSNRNLKTLNYSVRPNYRVPKPGAEPTIAGYVVTNVVEVTLDNLSQISNVIDASTQSGANVIRNLRYQLKNADAVRAQVLRQAAERARSSAEAIASGLGLKIARVLSAEEVTPQGGFVLAKSAPMAAGPMTPTPIEAGTIDVTANVIVRAEIAQ